MQERPHSHAARRLAVALGVSALAIVLLAPAASAAPTKTKLVSQSSAGTQGDERSFGQEISATGRFVAFDSVAGLVSGDVNGERDIYIRDFKKGKTKLVSKAAGGGSGNDDSWGPSISANGRFVVFTSEASDLIVGSVNNMDAVYVRDTVKNKTRLISRSSSGAQANAHSFSPSISADGRWVAFESAATNLVNKNTFGVRQIYLFDRKNNKLSLVSRNKKGKAGNDDSDDPANEGGDGRSTTGSP